MNRNIATCIILSIVTCGIYGIYWMYQLNNEVAGLKGENPKFDGILVIILQIVTCNIFGLYWMYTQGENVDEAKRRRGTESSNTGIVYLVLCLFGFGIVSLALMQNEINNLA